MEPVISLTISSNSEILAGDDGRPRRRGFGLVVLLSLALAGCTIEVGPPPESDPPLVPESAKAPPPPPQPTEPQAWSRDLNLDAEPYKIDPKVLADGLVAADSEVTYSGQRLTYESALSDERPLTAAEQALKRARERAEAAGILAPQAAAAPVAEVDSQALPPLGDSAAEVPVRQSRLPPPPKFPTTLQAPADATGEAGAAAEPAPEPGEALAAAEAAPGTAESRLPPPPVAPPQSSPESPESKVPEQLAAVSPAPGDQPPAAPAAPASPPASGTAGPAVGEAVAAVATSAPAAPAADAASDPATASFLAEAWDAPEGTILVQVSAVENKLSVIGEWHRLQRRYPQVLEPLRLVVEEAKLGDRGVFFRVQGGGFGSKEGASAACNSLISQGQACFVVVR